MGTEITGGQIKDGTVRNVDVASDAAIAITKLDSNVASKTYVDSAVGAIGIPTGSVQMYAGATEPSGWLFCDGRTNTDRATYPNLGNVLAPSKGTVTITIASPCVVTLSSHGLSTNDTIWLETTGALPTGLSVATLYYVKVINSNTFNLAATAGGVSLNTSGTQSGTHTLYHTLWGKPSASGKFCLPDLRGRVGIGVGAGTGLSVRALAETGGAEGHSLTLGQMPSHRHGLNNVSYVQATGTYSAAGALGSPTWGYTDYTGGSSAGSNGDAHNNVQPFLALNFVIKT